MLNLFKKKNYKNYSDYLKDNNVELFTAWVDPEIFELTGASPIQVLNKKANINKDISIDDAMKSLALMYNQMFTLAEMTEAFNTLMDKGFDEVYEAVKDNTDNATSGSFAKGSAFQVESLTDMFKNVRDNMEKKSLPAEAITSDKKVAIERINNYFDSIVRFWDLLCLSINGIAVRESYNLKKKAILDKIK